jgi:hypothetical protein
MIGGGMPPEKGFLGGRGKYKEMGLGRFLGEHTLIVYFYISKWKICDIFVLQV